MQELASKKIDWSIHSMQYINVSKFITISTEDKVVLSKARVDLNHSQLCIQNKSQTKSGHKSILYFRRY